MLSIARGDLINYLDELLNVSSFSDYAPNGLQIEGKENISLICSAVTASQDVIEKAKSLAADALLVHHGYFWKNEPNVLVGMKKKRIASLLRSDINLLAYHLPLDCHPEIGNNALLARRFQLKKVCGHTIQNTPNLLWSGELVKPQSFQEFLVFLEKSFGRVVQAVQAAGIPAIKRIAWCTGAAQDLIEAAAGLAVDAFISGEVSERTYYQAKELGIHYFACGHHATECDAIQVLGNHLAERFGIKHLYIDVENPF